MSRTVRQRNPVREPYVRPPARDVGLCGALGLRDEQCTLGGAHKAWHLDSDEGVAWDPDDTRHRVDLPAPVK